MSLAFLNPAGKAAERAQQNEAVRQAAEIARRHTLVNSMETPHAITP